MGIQPVSFVEGAARDLMPEALRLPSVVWSAFALFGRAHSTWRWLRYAELYGNPKNFIHLMAGHIVDYVIGDRLLVRVAAHSLLIATRLWECAEAQTEVKQRGEALLNCMFGRCTYMKETWSKGQMKTYGLSPSTVAWWQATAKSSIERITKIFVSFFKLLIASCKLAMRIADTVDAFYMSPEAQSHSVHTCFVNAAKWLEMMANNKEALLEGLDNNKELIIKILNYSPFTFNQLYCSVAKGVNVVEYLNDYSQAVSKVTGGTINRLVKGAWDGGMTLAGL